MPSLRKITLYIVLLLVYHCFGSDIGLVAFFERQCPSGWELTKVAQFSNITNKDSRFVSCEKVSDPLQDKLLTVENELNKLKNLVNNINILRSGGIIGEKNYNVNNNHKIGTKIKNNNESRR